MKKVNDSPLYCIHKGCNTIPTIVLEFQHPSGRKIIGQIITCNDHRQEGIKQGDNRFGRYNLAEYRYPRWLQKMHDEILQTRTVEGKPVAPEDIGRLKTFKESNPRSPAEKR